MAGRIVPLIAMQHLWDRSNAYLQENATARDVDIYDTQTQQFEVKHVKSALTPAGLTIERVDDSLSVSAEFVRYGSFTTEFTLAVEFSDDLRQLPTVTQHWQTVDSPDFRSGVSTVPRSDFHESAEDLISLIDPAWADQLPLEPADY
jgi:hypothetical protein